MGNEVKSSILTKLGKPSEKLSIEKRITGIENSEVWDYESEAFNRLSVIFVENMADTITWNIRENEKEGQLRFLLTKLEANWKVVHDSVSNPHAMPNMCFLIDESKGIKIEINAYREIVESVTKWSLRTIAGQKLGVKSPELYSEYCIAGHCSSASKNRKWKVNHCEYLKKVVENTRN